MTNGELPEEPPVGWATRSKYPPGYEPPPADPQTRARAESIIGFYLASIGPLTALLGGHQTAARIVSLILSTAGIVLCAHGGWRLRRALRGAERTLELVPLAHRELIADELAAVAALPRLERRLFGHSIRYTCDRAARPGNTIARSAKSFGVVGGFQLVVARQLVAASGAVGFTGVLALVAFDAAGFSGVLTGLTIAALFIATGWSLAMAIVRVLAAQRLGRAFRSNGSPAPQLPPPTRPPVPVPKAWAAAPGVLALDIIGIGLCLMTANAAAPRATGVFASSWVSRFSLFP